jgi:hypothetical protein
VLNYLSTMPWRDWGNGGITPPFLTTALNGGEWSASRLCRFTPGERASGTHWIGGWAPAPGWTLWRKQKLARPEIEPGVIQPRSPSQYRLT